MKLIKQLSAKKNIETNVQKTTNPDEDAFEIVIGEENNIITKGYEGDTFKVIK